MMNLKQITSSRTGRRQRGFSVVEAVVGMGLVGIVVGALYSALTSAFTGVGLARQNLRATEIMIERMDALRLYTWDQVNSATFIPRTFSADFDPKGRTNGTGSGVVYQGTLRIDPGPTDVAYGNDLKWVTITLDWKTGSVARRREFKTLICRNGLQSYLY